MREPAAPPLEADAPPGLEAEVRAATRAGRRICSRSRPVMGGRPGRAKGRPRRARASALRAPRTSSASSARVDRGSPSGSRADRRERCGARTPLERASRARASAATARRDRRRPRVLAGSARELAADPVAREAQVAVGGVAAKREPALRQETQDLLPRHREQRPHDPVLAALARARERREPALALAREQVRLDRVVVLVGGRRSRRRPRRHLGERLVADVPRPGLRREAELLCGAAGVRAPREEGEPEPPRVLRDEGEVPIGLPAASRGGRGRPRVASRSAPPPRPRRRAAPSSPRRRRRRAARRCPEESGRSRRPRRARRGWGPPE